MKSIKKRIIILLLVFLTLLLLLICIYIIFLNKSDNSNNVNNTENISKEQIYNDFIKDKIIPSGSFKLPTEYKGKIELVDFYKNLFNVVNYIEQIQNLKDIDSYFDKNREEIRKCLGIESLEDFNIFVKYLYSKDKIENFQQAKINTDSFKNSKNYLKFDIKFTYLNDVTLDFEVYLMNNDVSDYIAQYKVIED